MYMQPSRTSKKTTKRKKILPVIVGVVLIGIIVWVLAVHSHEFPSYTPTAKTHTAAPAVAPAVPQPFNKKQYSNSDPASLWVVVNKKHPLNPTTYAPPLDVPNVPLRLSAANGEMHMRPETARAVESLFAAAKHGGLSLMVASGYRSYNLQVSVYGNEVKSYGQAQADSESARPGYSEHQTGWSLDVEPASRACEVAACFADTPEGKWLAANAYKHGFIIRYPADKVTVTGYRYEPWHIRYIGTGLSNELHNQNTETLEEFFGVAGGTTY